MIIYLIRHGRQNSTACNVDVPLAPEGELQAKLLGKRMKNYPIDALYTSDLIRAVDTGRIAFADRPALLEKHFIRKELSEIDFGSLTGAADPFVKKFYADYYDEQKIRFREPSNRGTGSRLDRVNQYIGDFFVPTQDMHYPDGENGEMVLQRLLPVVKEWINGSYEHIAVVTHGGVIRILLCALFGGDFCKRLLFGTSLENCSITELHYDTSLGGFYLDRFNDYAHIEAEPKLMRKHYVPPNR